MEELIHKIMNITGEDYVTTLDNMIKDRELELRETTKELVQLRQLRNKLYERKIC